MSATSTVRDMLTEAPPGRVAVTIKFNGVISAYRPWLLPALMGREKLTDCRFVGSIGNPKICVGHGQTRWGKVGHVLDFGRLSAISCCCKEHPDPPSVFRSRTRPR